MSIAFYTGVSGMMASQTYMDATSNNIANVNTTGYKAQNAAFQDLLYTKMNIHSNYGAAGAPDENAYENADGEVQREYDLVGHGSKIGSVNLMYTQGGYLPTQRELDFAISGEGLFAVENNTKETEYTRNGRFNISIEGKKAYLVNFQGYHVLDRRGKQISLTVDSNGNVQTDELIDKLGIYHFTNPYGLTPADGGSFLESENSGKAVAAKAGDDTSTVIQYYLENSNVELGEQMVNVIQAQRSFQMNARVVQTADEIDEMINNLR